jgi:hypothetical protein
VLAILAHTLHCSHIPLSSSHHHQESGRVIEVGSSVTLNFSLRFGEGWNTVPAGTSGPIELIRWVR